MQGRLIAACSTPPGRGAVAIVRLSGENALDVACGMFGLSVEQVPDRTAVYGKLTAAGLCDSAVLLCFRAPRSYTGEDTAEIQCHGSPVIVDAILREAVFRGARIAEPGEFTRRAYQNGKLDLTAAEGIIDLIDSQSEAAAKAAFQLADGALYREIERISVLLTAAAADVGAVLDYPDEAEETDVDLRPIGAALDKLIDGYPAGTAAHDGVRVTLTGTVNAGKSTLFNALLGKDRAIVTDIPGTTRDTVTDSYEYKGVRFYLTDTAGVREATDAVERLGIERSRRGFRNGRFYRRKCGTRCQQSRLGRLRRRRFDAFGRDRQRRGQAQRIVISKSTADRRRHFADQCAPVRSGGCGASARGICGRGFDRRHGRLRGVRTRLRFVGAWRSDRRQSVRRDHRRDFQSVLRREINRAAKTKMF